MVSPIAEATVAVDADAMATARPLEPLYARLCPRKLLMLMAVMTTMASTKTESDRKAFFLPSRNVPRLVEC